MRAASTSHSRGSRPSCGRRKMRISSRHSPRPTRTGSRWLREAEARELSRRAASVGDYRALAKARLPHFLFEYVDGGSYDEVTLRRNLDDLRSIALRQRVLRDVSSIDLTTSLFEEHWSMPVGLGPVGLA